MTANNESAIKLENVHKDDDKFTLKSKIKMDLPAGENLNMASLLLEAFRRHSDKTLLTDATSGLQLTGADIAKQVKSIVSNLLVGNLMKPGDVVMTLCEHNVLEVVVAFSVIVAGGSLYGIKVEDGFSEWLSYCQLVRPQVIVTESRLHQQVRELKQQLAIDDLRIIWLDNPTKASRSEEDDANNNAFEPDYYDALIKEDQVVLFDKSLLGGADCKPIDDNLFKEETINGRIKADKLAMTYILTSGSTSRPKVVELLHKHVVYTMFSLISATRHPVEGGGMTLPFREGAEVFAGDLPLDHGAGITTIAMAMYQGFNLVVFAEGDVELYLQSVAKYKISSAIASTMFSFRLLTRLKELIKSNCLLPKYGDLSSLKFIACCGSKVAFADLVKEIQSHEMFKHLIVSQCYGATEIGYMTTLQVRDTCDKLHSVGNLMPGMLARVVDPESGKPCGPHERGQLHIYCESKFEKYMCHKADDPQRMVANCHDERNFYLTGDQVHYDEQQRFYVHGRYKDTLVLMEEWKILPAELEELVDQHPLVQLSAVIGTPDPELPGCHAPKAFIKLISSNSPDFERLESEELRGKLLSKDLEFIGRDIYNFVASRTAKPKHLRGGVKILDQFPTNGILKKIDRKALKLIVD